MAFQLTDVVPWGRTLEEYEAMFSLTEQDLRGSILGCGDGPASFNAEATVLGSHVVSADPIYQFSAAALQSRIDETAAVIGEQLKQNLNEFVWDHFPTPEALIGARMAAISNLPRRLRRRSRGRALYRGCAAQSSFRGRELRSCVVRPFLVPLQRAVRSRLSPELHLGIVPRSQRSAHLSVVRIGIRSLETFGRDHGSPRE